MKRKLAPLLVILLAASGLVTSSSGHPVAAVSQRIRPDLPRGVFVARVYYEHLDELEDLTDYDVWEYNNLAERYVLVALDGAEYANLENSGWLIEVDQEATTGLTASELLPFATGYSTVDDYYDSLKKLNGRYPQLVELVKYGESTCLAKSGCTTPGGEHLAGFDLLALRISNENILATSAVDGSDVSRGNKPVFFLLANIHAREIATPEIAMRLLEHLLVNYGKDADITWLVDWHEIWVVPLANPDGHRLVELGAQEPYNRSAFYQRKNANLDADGDNAPDCPVWPPESSWQYGVDLNRNHRFAWGGEGSSLNPCAQSFRGPGPVSEVEVASLQQLVEALIPDQRGDGAADAALPTTTGLLLTLHSFGDLVIWPWGYDVGKAPNHEGLKAVGDKLASFNGYQSCQASTCLYTASGTTDDWAYGELGIPAFTYEIGQRFMPDYAEIDELLWPDNLPSLLYAAKIARTPYKTILGPAINRVQGTIPPGEEFIEITAVIDDSDHGDSHVSSATYSIDLPYWAPGAKSMPLAAVDGAFDDDEEVVTTVLPLDAVDPGLHMLYVTGQNSDGHLGVTEAIFIEVISYNTSYTYIPFYAYSP